MCLILVPCCYYDLQYLHFKFKTKKYVICLQIVIYTSKAVLIHSE